MKLSVGIGEGPDDEDRREAVAGELLPARAARVDQVPACRHPRPVAILVFRRVNGPNLDGNEVKC